MRRGRRRPPRGRRSRRAASRPARAPARGSRPGRAARRRPASSGSSFRAEPRRRAGSSRSRAVSRRPDAPVPARQAAEPGRAQRVAQIAEREVASAVALAGEREHGVRAEPDLAVGPHRRVDAEKRERRIGNRIDEPAHEVATFWLEDEVVAAERDDPRLGRRAGERRDAIRVDTCADDHPRLPRPHRPGSSRRRPARAARREPRPRARSSISPPASRTSRGVCLGDAREVDDGGLRRVERLEARRRGARARGAARGRSARRAGRRSRATAGGARRAAASSSSVVATTTLPQRRIGNPPLLAVGEQALPRPSTQSRALSEPGA